MKKWVKYLIGILVVVLILSIGGYAIYRHSQKLTGIYKLDEQYAKGDEGEDQPYYFYFKKNGKLMYAEPDAQVPESDTFYYGSVARGSWKSLGHNMYQLKFHDVYDNDFFSLKAKREGNKLHTYNAPRKAKYSWDADTSTKQKSMSPADFMKIYNKSKVSDLHNIGDNGYAKPDNTSSSDDDDSEMTFDEAADLIQKGGFTDFDYDRDSKTHDGSHATKDGYFMVTYPGAKGQDHYTITKKGNGKYQIKAEYGSSDGGFTLLPDQNSFGPTSATVTK